MGAKRYEYEGETFLLDDSDRCHIKVTYVEHPDLSELVMASTPAGTPGIYIVGGPGLPKATATSPGDGVDQACKILIARRQMQEVVRIAAEAGRAGHERDCEALHEFVAGLPPD